MKVGLIYYTKDYHKLVEMTARECYQSYNKLGEESHRFVKGIMGAGHISIASVGNIVFSVGGFSGIEDYANSITDLMTMKEINNYIRWTAPDPKNNPGSVLGTIISMNLLTLLDINNKIEDYSQMSKLWKSIKHLVSRVPELNWFFDDKSKLEPRENIYTSKGEPEIYKPVILTEDYTELKAKGLTDYELDVHATVTMNLKVDRATGLQIWRHADMAGGTELSQRYVKRDKAEYRKMVGFERGDYPDLTKYMEATGNTEELAKKHFDEFVGYWEHLVEEHIKDYADFMENLQYFGVKQSRSKEIARALLPNAMTTKLINCRPLRQWKHFLNLRDTNHAQAEIREDSKAIKAAFDKVGIKYQ